MLLTLFQNNLNVPISTYGTLKKWNGSSWVIYRLKNYNGIDVRGKDLKIEFNGEWKVVNQA